MLSPVLGARCLVLAHDNGVAVVVDPGAGVTDRVLAVVREKRVEVRAVLATHGHADHVWDAGPLARELAVPVLVHRADRYRLGDPWGTLGPLGAAVAGRDGPLAAMVRAAGLDPEACDEPADVRTFGADEADGGGRDDEDLGVRLGLPAGLLVARHAPGHTEGSTIYLVDGGGPAPVVVAGDVLFAGSVGRTDLPGGDPSAMARTLRDVVATLPPAALVLPGHGPRTTMATELATNPYLSRLSPPRPPGPPAGAPGRGH